MVEASSSTAVQDLAQVPLEVDGAMMEGGGQLFRMSIAYAYLLRRPVKISRIRANRARGGGLANQHLTGLNSVVQLVPGCKVSGNAKKSTQVEFDPKQKTICRDRYSADCDSAGAIGLVMQMLMPCLLFNEKTACSLAIMGGTHVNFSPTVFPVEHVLLPALGDMGAQITLTVDKCGFYPDVKGKVTVNATAITQPLQAIQLVDRGSASASKLVIRVKPAEQNSQQYYEERFKPRLLELLATSNLSTVEVEWIEAEIDQLPPRSRVKTLSVSAQLIFPNRTLLHSSVLVEGNNQLHDNQKDYAASLFDDISSLAAASSVVVDEHHCDQLLAYMAVAQGRSEMVTKKPLTMHTQTQIVLLAMFRPELEIEQEPLDDAIKIKITGLGLSPERD